MPAAGGTLRGRLVDDATGKALSGTVELLTQEDDAALVERLAAARPREPIGTARTGPDGSFSLEVTPGSSKLDIEAEAEDTGAP